MLKSVSLHNFQSHENSLLEFHRGFNVVTGASDNGKSSIVRAIQWLATNKPKGISFIRKGENNVNISVNDGNCSISRTRTAKDTGNYSINNNNYSFMAGEVPLEIQQVLNLSDINIQSQLDSHFLILDTPGNIARYLNDITKLDKLSNAVANLRSKKRTGQTELDEIRKFRKDTEDYLDSGIVERCEALEELFSEISTLTAEKNELLVKIQKAIKIKADIEEFEKVKIPEKELNELVEIAGVIAKTKDNQLKLSNKIVDVKRILNSLNEADKSIEIIQEKRRKDRKELQTLKEQLKNCPYCNQQLDLKSKKILLETRLRF